MSKAMPSTMKLSFAKDGTELLSFLKTNSPDLIFIDLNMPVKNGFEVLKEIKQNDHMKDLPVIIFTTSDHSTAIETSRELGATLYVPKPLSFNVLKKVISHILAINWKTFIPSAEEFVYRGN